jgi:hypothetical protein
MAGKFTSKRLLRRSVFASIFGPALAAGLFQAASAHAQYFVDVGANGSGSASAEGFDFITHTQYGTFSNSFSGINTGITVGSQSDVWADSNDTFSQTSKALNLGVTADGNWNDSSNGVGTIWQPPNTSEMTSGSLSFQVPITGAYKLDLYGAGPFGTSQSLAQNSDDVSVTGVSGSNTVLSLSLHDGIGPTTDTYILSPGVLYSVSAACNGSSAPYMNEIAIPNFTDAGITVTAIPEPVSISSYASRL